MAWVPGASPGTSNSCAVFATTCGRTLFQPHKTYSADDACPSGLCKGAGGQPPREAGGVRLLRHGPVSAASPSPARRRRTRVPASGISPCWATMSPFSVFGPSSGKCVPSLRLSARSGASPSTTTAPSAPAGRFRRHRAPGS